MKLLVLALSLYAALVVAGHGVRAQTRTLSESEPRPAAEGEPEAGEDEVVRVATTLVTVPVSVLDRDGRYATGLRQEDFRVYEDGVEQQVAFFNSVDQPIFVVLLVDTSGSMAQSLAALNETA